jgi:hypothetical protein
MDPPGTPSFLTNLLQWNFDQHYTSNRSPFGIFLHGAWLLEDPTRIQVLADFFSYAASKQGVFFVTNKQLISWMQNPTDIASTQTKFACQTPLPPLPTPEVCDGIDNDLNGLVDDGVSQRCSYSSGYFDTCGSCYLNLPSVAGDFTIA